MDFQQVLCKIVSDYGKEKIFDKNIVSLLADYKAFEENPSYRIFYKLLIGDGSLFKLLSSNDNDQLRLIEAFLSKTGLDKFKFFAFLDTLSLCYSGKHLSSERNFQNTSNTHNDSVEKPQNPSGSSRHTNFSENITFLGLPLGSSYFAFENAIFSKRGYQKSRRKSEVSFVLPNFLFGKIGHITLYKFPDFKPVYKVSTRFEQGQKLEAISLYARILDLYKRKYGDGHNISTYDVEWTANHCSIYLYIKSSDVIIDYKISSPEIDRLETQQKIEAERKRKELEQLRKKREEEARRLEEEKRKQLENQYFDDI